MNGNNKEWRVELVRTGGCVETSPDVVQEGEVDGEGRAAAGAREQYGGEGPVDEGGERQRRDDGG